MGVLIVHCPNRPEDEVIDCGVYGMRRNMRSHNIDEISGEVVVGITLDRGQKLTMSGDSDDKLLAQIESTRAKSAGAVLGTEVSGIPSTFLPGGIDPNTIKVEVPVESKPAESKSSIAKSAQAKEGGE